MILVQFQVEKSNFAIQVNDIGHFKKWGHDTGIRVLKSNLKNFAVKLGLSKVLVFIFADFNHFSKADKLSNQIWTTRFITHTSWAQRSTSYTEKINVIRHFFEARRNSMCNCVWHVSCSSPNSLLLHLIQLLAPFYHTDDVLHFFSRQGRRLVFALRRVEGPAGVEPVERGMQTLQDLHLLSISKRRNAYILYAKTADGIQRL